MTALLIAIASGIAGYLVIRKARKEYHRREIAETLARRIGR